MSFQREIRYTVLKHTDVTEALDADETEQLIYLEEKIEAYRKSVGKPPLMCVVVESDWPEHDIVWNLIQKRVEGAAPMTDKQKEILKNIQNETEEN